NCIKIYWDFIKREWKYNSSSVVALKELKDYKYDISEFIKAIKEIEISDYKYVTKFFGISKNPSAQNYIIVMESYDDTTHIHDVLHSKNALIFRFIYCNNRSWFINNLILNSDNKNNNVYGLISFIPPEFGGIMYEMATENLPFADQAHDTYLIIDICNGVRPKVPDIMLILIPKCYLDKMYQCWDDDHSKRLTARQLNNIIQITFIFYMLMIIKKRMNKFHEQKLIQSLYNIHPQSCYISRHIYTLYELRDSLKDIKSGKCAANCELVFPSSAILYWNGWIGALFPYDNLGKKITKNEIDPDEVSSGLVHVSFDLITLEDTFK
ncbi:3146_t:CDS:2, partial [Diversispora eburnea]